MTEFDPTYLDIDDTDRRPDPAMSCIHSLHWQLMLTFSISMILEAVEPETAWLMLAASVVGAGLAVVCRGRTIDFREDISG